MEGSEVEWRRTEKSRTEEREEEFLEVESLPIWGKGVIFARPTGWSGILIIRQMEREKQIYRVTLVGSAGNALLVVFKFVAGVLGHSSAMVADAVHSLSDFITDIIVLVFVGISSRPQDQSHDYGHGKFETLATLFISLALFGAAVGIIASGAMKISGTEQSRAISHA